MREPPRLGAGVWGEGGYGGLGTMDGDTVRSYGLMTSGTASKGGLDGNGRAVGL